MMLTFDLTQCNHCEEQYQRGFVLDARIAIALLLQMSFAVREMRIYLYMIL